MTVPRRCNARKLAIFAAVALAAASSLLSLGAVPALASMDLGLQDTPDLYSSYIELHYSPEKDLLTTAGKAQVLTVASGAKYRIAGGTFSLTAIIDDNGQLHSDAIVDGQSVESKVVIGGAVAALGYSGTLLEGNLKGFRYGEAGEAFGFLFQITDGAAAALFGGIGGTAGVILHTRAFPGDFCTPFNNETSSNAGVVPEPAAFLIWPLLVLAGAIMIWRRRPKRLPS